MASSLNCLTAGDSIPENILDSPVRSESSMFYSRSNHNVKELLRMTAAGRDPTFV